ncbi:MAG TPA: DUF2917 domain-containing protein [Casimicrobiaceae bacterium]|jgi:hypothetical protein|nr:DUF2917 domain-containing protein [Casimicrobiaceae bacterium]
MLCTGYTKAMDLDRGDLVRLDDARGTTLRVTRGTLWVTQEKEHNDVVLYAGDVWAVERNGVTLVEAQSSSALCLVGPGAEDSHLRLAHRGGKRLRGLLLDHAQVV